MASRLAPMSLEEMSQFEELTDILNSDFKEIPNSIPTIARRPRIMKATLDLFDAVMNDGEVDRSLKWMVGYIASRASGCMYCSAHTATSAMGSGVDPDKVTDIWSFEQSDKFNEDEKAALRFALAAGSVPNAVTDESFAQLQDFFDDGQIVEILSVVAMFGFWNRWNDTIGTDLEITPLTMGEKHLKSSGWKKPT